MRDIFVGEDDLARVYSFDLQFEGSRRTQFYRELIGFRSNGKLRERLGPMKGLPGRSCRFKVWEKIFLAWPTLYFFVKRSEYSEFLA